jgi:hypothetical protein
MGVFAKEIQTTGAGLSFVVVPRGLDTDTASVVSDMTSCITTSGSTMPTPSAVFFTETVDGATAGLTVTFIPKLTT